MHRRPCIRTPRGAGDRRAPTSSSAGTAAGRNRGSCRERSGGPDLRGAQMDYDVIVIGTGAGGGTLAHRLAPSGKRILLLERGDWLAREPQNWLSQDVFVD